MFAISVKLTNDYFKHKLYLSFTTLEKKPFEITEEQTQVDQEPFLQKRNNLDKMKWLKQSVVYLSKNKLRSRRNEGPLPSPGLCWEGLPWPLTPPPIPFTSYLNFCEQHLIRPRLDRYVWRTQPSGRTRGEEWNVPVWLLCARWCSFHLPSMCKTFIKPRSAIPGWTCLSVPSLLSPFWSLNKQHT